MLKSEENNNSGKQKECSVCLEKLAHPIKLPCQHVFCFLCVKGCAIRNHKCPLCRTSIPDDYFSNPQVVDGEEEEEEESYSWFYQGASGGWWAYDLRTNKEIETAYNENKSETKVSISGFTYVIDLNSMVQYREGIPNRWRRIKRDNPDIANKKGIAGLLLSLISKSSSLDPSTSTSVPTSSSSSSPSSSNSYHLRKTSHLFMSNHAHQPQGSGKVDEMDLDDDNDEDYVANDEEEEEEDEDGEEEEEDEEEEEEENQSNNNGEEEEEEL